MPVIKVRTQGALRVPVEAAIEEEGILQRHTDKKGIVTSVTVAAGTIIDKSQLPKDRVSRMENKDFPAFVEPDAAIPSGGSTLVLTGEVGGQKVEVDKSVGREHASSEQKKGRK
jgi:hypothetical protein